MSLSPEIKPEFARITAILKELGKEDLLDIFKQDELTDNVLDRLKTEQEMRAELKAVDISSGAAIAFSDTWFSRKKSDKNVPTTSKESISKGAGVADSTKEKRKPQRSGDLKSEERDYNENFIPEEVKEEQESKPFNEAEGKISDRRLFGIPAEEFHYVKGNVLPNTEDKRFEYKALTQESPQKLPWKIMDKARPFICGILNGGGHGIIYFGIGDSYDPSTKYKRGEIIGLEIEDLRDEISKAFQSTLDDHIKSDNGKMTKGGDMNCVNIHFVPVWESEEPTNRYVIEIEVKRDWMFCQDYVYYFQKWSNKRPKERGATIEKTGLHDLYKIDKDNWEDAVIRTQGSSVSVKAIETAKQVKGPLSQKYKEWQAREKDKAQKGSHSTRDTEPLDIQKVSTNIRKSLRELDFRENSYILIANKVHLEYRGSNILAFLKKIPWIAVFDLFDFYTEKDGLYYIVNETNDCARPTRKELDDFKDTKINETISKVETTWITRSKEMHENNWTRFSKDPLYKALTAFCESPTGRVHCVFLLLSNENLQEMADIVDSSFSIIGYDANKHITIISERKELGTQMIKFLKDDISKDIKSPCSIFGTPFDLLRNNVKALLGSVEFDEPDATTELPYLNGTLCHVRNKRIKSLTDLEIYIPHPDLSSELEDIKKAKENFYMGNVISQMNLFHNDAIERTLETKLISRTDECLQELSSLEEVELFVETITLRYESGSGASTLGRQILWKRRKKYRCAVVKKISEKTDHQISQLQKFSYETSETSPFLIPPVLVLVDNWPEQQVHHLSDKLSKSKTRCILLSTVPLDRLTKDNAEDFTLGKLDNTETNMVRGVLSTLQSQRKIEAAKILDRERRFVWLGLELFGRQYAEIKPRLSKHIYQVLSQSLNDRLKDAYEMILHFCCLLDYYSKRRSIYPQPCVEEILYVRGGLQADEEKRIDKIHDKFRGLLLDDTNEFVGYHGWKPAHPLVGEVVREEIDLFETAKKLVEEMNKGRTYVKKFLTEDTVTIFLQREKMVENPSESESDGIEDEFLGILEIRTKYSQLILDILPNQEKHVKNALDLLITLNEEVTTIQHKAHTFQQIARMFAYEIGMNHIPEEILPLVQRVNDIVSRDNSSIILPENGFDLAHRVIDEATKLQQSYLHHIVTKATFYRIKLKHLDENITRNNPNMEELKLVIKEAINTAEKGIDLYDNTLKTENRGSYLYAMIGKIQTIVVLVEMFKKLPFFAQHRDGQDESFRHYVTFQNHPDELKSLLSEENLNYFIFLTTTAVHLLNDFLGEIQIRRKLSYKKHEAKELENAKIRTMKLRTKFYEVTKLDRTNIEQGVVLKEDIVNDLLYKRHEWPFSSWRNLTPNIIGKIYALLKDAIPTETTSHNAMVTYARAALQQGVNIDNLSELVQQWCKKYPTSEWAHTFNYMIHFPVPNGSLKTDIAAVKSSVNVCRVRILQSKPGYRKSRPEYLLGKGNGVNSIIPPHHVLMPEAVELKTENSRSKDVQLNKTEFWRSRIVYEKLERLNGKKTKQGVLKYKEIEIPFDNELYPHESRDELWFCLGFTITGPYAYDPVDRDTYKEMQERFQDNKTRNLPQGGESQKTSNKAWQVGDSTHCRSPSAKPKSAFLNQYTTRNPEARSQKTKTELHRTAAPREQNITQESKNDTREESLITGATSSSYDFRPNTNNEETWKKDPKFTKTVRSTEGHQKTFYPQYLDRNNKVYHGAQVKGANKSVECNRHSCSNFPKPCTFAHPWKGDPVLQTICDFCTKAGLKSCNEKKEHKKRYHYNLGPFLSIERV